MSIFYFRLDTFDTTYYDDMGSTSTIISNSNVDVTYSDLGLARDFNTLNAFGRFPFPRYRHANLIDAFSRIKDLFGEMELEKYREKRYKGKN